MKKKMVVAASIVFFLSNLPMVTVSVSIADAAAYFIAPNGNDGNTGAIDSPWQTIKKGNQTLVAGDTVYIRQGTYHERIEPIHSGQNGAPISYRNYQNEIVTITGLWGKGAELVGREHITIAGLIFDGRSKVQIGIYVDKHGDHITIKNCTVRNYRNADNTAGHGIWTGLGGVSHVLIEDCKIYHNGTTNPNLENGNNISIFGGADHVTIRECDIYESYTEDGVHLVPTSGKASDILIENCRFWGNKEDGIDIKRVDNVVVRSCEFWGHRPSPTGGGSGIQIHQGANNVTVDNCVSHDNEKYGVRIEYNCSWLTCPATQNITIQRSRFYGNAEGISVVGGQWNAAKPGMLKNIRLHNNVLYDNRTGIYLYAHPGGEIASLVSRNNVFMNNSEFDNQIHSSRIDYQATNNYYANSISSDSYAPKTAPLFLDAENHDFRLPENSPLIDQGIDVGLPFNGSAPDIGAHEYDGDTALIPDPPTNVHINKTL